MIYIVLLLGTIIIIFIIIKHYYDPFSHLPYSPRTPLNEYPIPPVCPWGIPLRCQNRARSNLKMHLKYPKLLHSTKRGREAVFSWNSNSFGHCNWSLG